MANPISRLCRLPSQRFLSSSSSFPFDLSSATHCHRRRRQRRLCSSALPPPSAVQIKQVLRTSSPQVQSFCSRKMTFFHIFLGIPLFHVDRGGEDSFFVSDYNGGVLAVADGVSGWAAHNVDPSQFSRELIENVSNFLMDKEVNFDPQVLMRKAHAATSSIGSATVIIALLDKNGFLRIANVGDCGLRIIRKNQLAFATSPQEHYFDCPYQLSSESIGQTYRDAMICTVELTEGDIIVIGSDGLFDNVYDREIISIVSKSQDVIEAAKSLAYLASNHSIDADFDSPYSVEARSKGFDVPWWKKILGKKLTGGKLDDITVIVGRVYIPTNEKI